MSSDGANYLYELLLRDELHSFQQGRWAAHYILKTPTWILMKLGMVNFDTLSFVFGMSFYLQMLIGIVLSYVMLRDKKYILYPILSSYLFALNTEYAIESEAIFLQSLFWPVFFYLEQDRDEVGRSIIFVLSLVALSMSYETFMIISILIGYQIWRYEKLSSSKRWLLYVFLVGTSIFQLKNIIFHEYPQNVKAYLASIGAGQAGLNFAKYANFPHVNLFFMVVVLIYISILLALLIKKNISLWLTILFGVAGVLALYTATIYPDMINRYVQYMTRTLTSVGPLLIFPLFHIAKKRRNHFDHRKLSFLVQVLILLQFGSSLLTTHHWRLFVQELNQITTGKYGEINIHETKMMNKISQRKMSANFQDWSLPLYSIFLDKDKVITAIVRGKLDSPFSKRILFGVEQNKVLFEKYGFKIIHGL